ncbi:hypothetical protein E3N88_25555 [Mikania micrantha]|uniref:Retrotransposon gag domain-containing protein n=1 Tax=Mikania micrantha TaxID=192012 RepID=A0A5N6N5G8_9ASTR|nr:hypothetical protein E3N88_25555 [Mikania micrantha]
MLNAWAEQFIVEPPPEDGPQFEVDDLEEGDFDEDPDEDPKQDEDDDGADSDISHGPYVHNPKRKAEAARIKMMVERRVNKVLAEYEANRLASETNGTNNEGAVGMLRWVEKVESVFAMCECTEENRVKYATGTLEGPALTWWNTHVQTLGLEGANSMSWADFTRLLQEEYCPRDEIRNLEAEFWVLKMVGSEIEKYCTQFHELCKLCPAMVTPEYKKIEQFISGLPEQIQSMVTAFDLTDTSLSHPQIPTRGVDSMQEMMNIRENLARNGVTDCPKSQNEEKYKNVKVEGSRRLLNIRIAPRNVSTSPDRCSTLRNPSD